MCFIITNEKNNYFSTHYKTTNYSIIKTYFIWTLGVLTVKSVDSRPKLVK